MARQRSFLGLVPALAVLTVMSAPRSASACVCGRIEPDAAYQNALLVFTGTVEKVTEQTRGIVQDGKFLETPNGSLTRITVEEYFKGAGGAEIELRGSNTTCDIGFEVGKRYIVYASQNGQTGELGAFTCSRTRLLDDYANPDMSYLRRVVRGELPMMLYGYAFKNTADSAKRGAPDPLGLLAVTVEGEGRRLELKTDVRGYFETFDLQPGSYRIYTSVTGKLRGADARTVELGSGVASVTFLATTMGSLSGRVVDRESSPVSELQVELLQAGQLSGRATNYVSTSEDGRFVFGEVVAGRYVLAVNSIGRRSLYGAPFVSSYFPNAASSADAQVVTIVDGVPTDVGDFVLQERYPTVAVSGVVLTVDGKPVVGAYVYLDKSGGEWDAARRSVQTDAAGRFVHQAFEGVAYILRAIADGPTGGTLDSDRVEVIAKKNENPVRLVVKYPK
ncbi:MAG TPA: carboxypeptidase regulatory-like domain-containing protein [Blastocatellia bacterium]|nr:carboxypeptidase regulatory-like domain-containing protein [Blastocatellia bacterium]